MPNPTRRQFGTYMAIYCINNLVMLESVAVVLQRRHVPISIWGLVLLMVAGFCLWVAFEAALGTFDT
jgi:hypothetical protein